MTSRTATLTKTDRDFEPFPEFPPRDDMENWKNLFSRGQASALAIHVGEDETTTVGCEIPVGLTLDRRAAGYGIRIPDLMLSWNSRPDLIEEHGGYAIDRQGKPPDFALEVASKTTGVIDYTEKRADYERYEVLEYWRFDSTGGRYHDVALAGDRLVDGRYERIEVEWLDDARCRGYSESLGLYVCWEDGDLRFYDPVSGEYLRDHYEEVERAESEAERADRAEARAEAEAAARRIEAARVAELEAELRRLRGE